jgi:transposase
MPGFVKGIDRGQSMLFPPMLDDYVSDDNSVRAVDVFIESLDLAALGFNGAQPSKTGRPSYDPATMLKIYVYGYLNRIQSSRRLELECQRNRNIELIY